jgi:hypothetical protein
MELTFCERIVGLGNGRQRGQHTVVVEAVQQVGNRARAIVDLSVRTTP